MTTLLEILNRVKNGQCTVTDALQKLQVQPAESIEEACIDHQRSLITGIHEVVYGASKSADQIINICTALLKKNEVALVTRVDSDKAEAIQALQRGV